MMLKEWHWEITRRCNLFCWHCLTGGGRVLAGELTAAEAQKAINVMADCGCLYLMITGGEPLARKDLVPILRSGFERGLRLGLLTNGFKLNKKTAGRLGLYLKTAGVSLDGASAKTHDALRGRGSFQAAGRAIRLLSSFLPVTAYLTASALNIDELGDMIDFAFSLGAGRIHISEINLGGRAKTNKNLLALSPSQKETLKRLAREITGAGHPTDSGCGANLASVYLSAAGLAYPCSEIGIRRPDYPLGRITAKGFRARLLKKALTWRMPESACCYQILAGQKAVFCLNTGLNCPFCD